MQGRTYVIPDDIKALAEPVLAHRIILRPNAEMQGQSAGKLVAGPARARARPPDGVRRVKHGEGLRNPPRFHTGA